MAESTTTAASLTRRNLLKLGAAAAAGAAVDLPRPAVAPAQTPKRGGTLRLALQATPSPGFDPHQTISFLTMVPLSFAYSRLVKVKAGPSVKPMTYPIEPDLAESWTQPNDTTYVFKLKKGVRWHPKPPVNGRELTADDIKYTYDRFLTITGNGNRARAGVRRQDRRPRQVHGQVHPEGAERLVPGHAGLDVDLDHRQGVRREVRRSQEGRVGGGHRAVDARALGAEREDLYVRNPNYFVPGLPYADAVEIDHRQGSVVAAGRLALRASSTSAPSTSRSCAGSISPWPGSASPDSRPPSTPGSPAGPSASRSTGPVQRHPRPPRALPGDQPGRDLRVQRVLPGRTGPPTPPSPPRRGAGRSRSISSAPRGASSTSSRRRRPSASWPRRAIRTGSRRRWRRHRPATVPTSWTSSRSR